MPRAWLHSRWQWLRANPVVFFIGCFSYFLCSSYLIPSTFIYIFSFYLFFIPAFLYAWVRDPAFIQAIPRSVGTIGIAVFFLYVAEHGLIGQFPGQKFLTTAKDLAFNSLFILMVLAVFTRSSHDYLRVLRPMIPVAALGAIISIDIYLADGRFHERLAPFGKYKNNLLGANVYAIAAIVAAHTFFQPTSDRRWKILSALSVVLCTLMILLAQSRAPTLTLSVCFGVTLLLYRQWRLLGIAAALGLIGIADLSYYLQHGTSLLRIEALYHYVEMIYNRPKYRLAIWSHALTLIEARPWGGYGMRAAFWAYLPGSVNPHNLYLSALYYLGIPGLILLLVPLLAAFATTLQRLHTPYGKLCLVLLLYAVGATLTDQGQAVKSANALWIFYWLPIAMALAQGRPQKVSVGQA